jgi:hypothetical protein
MSKIKCISTAATDASNNYGIAVSLNTAVLFDLS